MIYDPPTEYFTSRGLAEYRKLIEAGITIHCAAGLFGHIEGGLPTGGFIEAVLCNDLKYSFAKADLNNRDLLFHYAKFLYNACPVMPMRSYGSLEDIKSWVNHIQKHYPERIAPTVWWKDHFLELLEEKP